MNDYKNTMVVYESAYLAINYLPDDSMKWEAMEGLLKYGFYGEVPESDNPFINMIYVQALPSMQNAKQRYEKAVENGRKGGRPTEVSTEEIIEMKKNGMTNKQIAAQLGCSEKNIENRITTYNKSHPNNPNNLSVSVSVSESVSDSVSDSVSVASAQKRELEELSIEELHSIINDSKKHMKYIDIQKKYNLSSMVTKDTQKECESIIRDRNLIAQQERDREERAKQPRINYEALYRQKCSHEATEERTDINKLIEDCLF